MNDTQPESQQDQQRRRLRIAWLIGAPVGGLVIGIWIASIPLSVAEEDYRRDQSAKAVREYRADPPTTTVNETTTVFETVAAPPLGGQPVTPQETSNAAVIRQVCESRFPDRSQQAQVKQCVSELSG